MKRTVIAPVVVALTMLLGACSSANGGSTASTSTSRATTAGAPVDQLGAISITAKGFVPSWPIVPLNQRVTFTNHTDTAQQIIFDNEHDASGAFVTSPMIPPKGKWVYAATTFTSLAYHSPNLPGAAGRIQVDPPAEP
jgi:hypothetical protein